MNFSLDFRDQFLFFSFAFVCMCVRDRVWSVSSGLQVFVVYSTLSSLAWGSLAWSNSTLHVDLNVQCSDHDGEKYLRKYKCVSLICANKMSVSHCVHKRVNIYIYIFKCVFRSHQLETHI